MLDDAWVAPNGELWLVGSKPRPGGVAARDEHEADRRGMAVRFVPLVGSGGS
jgi:hypothetical protein